jgi:hypothetical protein
MKKEIIFTLPAEALEGATEAIVLGDFNNWTPGHEFELKKQEDGSFKTTVQLEEGKTYQYRFLLNNGRWQNDYNAQDYVPVSGYFVDNCVITVPETVESVEVNQATETINKVEQSKPKVKKAKAVKVSSKAEATKTKKDSATKTVKAKSSAEKVKPKKAGKSAKAANKETPEGEK